MIWAYIVLVLLLLITGFYCLLFTYNMIRALIGLELLIKAVTLLIVLFGYISGQTALMQSFATTLIVVEVVVMVVAAGVILGLHGHIKTLNLRKKGILKG